MSLSNIKLGLTASALVASALSRNQVQVPNAVPALTPGTTTNKADLLYVATRTATAAGDAIDVRGAGLLQPDGNTFNAVEIVAVVVVNKSTTASVTVGGGTNAVPGITLSCGPGGMAAAISPADPAWPTTAGSADVVRVVSGGADAEYQIFILGRSA